MFVDLIASLTFYIIPYLTGRFFTKSVVGAWVLGALLWFILFFILKDGKIIKYLAIFISSASIIALATTVVKEKPKVSVPSLLAISGTLIFVSIIYFGVWRINTPYPMQLNWDMYEHITLANQISQGNISFFTTNISDTFTINTYSPIFSVLLSMPAIIFQKSLVGIYWWLEYWHFILTAIATFLLAKKVFNNNLLSFVSAIISSLTFESLMAYTTLFLIPQTLVALVAILALIEIKEYKPIWVLLLFFMIFLTHYIVGILCILILLFVYLSKHLNFFPKAVNFGIIGSLVLLLMSIGANFIGAWEVLGREEAVHFNFSLMEKAGFFWNWYGLFFFVFLPIGFIKIITSENHKQKLVLILALVVLAVSLAPFSYFLKFYVLGHYLLNIIIVAGIGVLLLNLPRYLKVIGASLAILVFFTVFYTNQLIFKEPLIFRNFNTNISFEEIKAGRWLSSYKNGKNLFLISDPGLQYLLEGESGINSPGGAYMSLENRRLLSQLDSFSDSHKIKNNLLRIKDRLEENRDREVLFVIGGRYFAWQNLSEREKESIFYNIWTPYIIKEQDRIYIDFLKKSPEFKPIYENEELVIFSTSL